MRASPSEIARRWGNAVTRAQLAAAGCTARELAGAVASGALTRVRRGHYVTRDATREQRVALQIGGRLSCSSAAATYGLWAGRDPCIHVAVARNASRLGGASLYVATRIHWRDALRSPECWRIGLEDCLRSVVACSDRENAIATLDTAIGSKLISPARLVQAFATEPVLSRVIASRARPGSDSGVESLARQRLEQRGLTVRQQIPVAGVGRVDLLIEERLFVELDGFAYHSSPGDFDRDRRRDAAFLLGDHRRLRFTAGDVLTDWMRVERSIVAALALA